MQNVLSNASFVTCGGRHLTAQRLQARSLTNWRTDSRSWGNSFQRESSYITPVISLTQSQCRLRMTLRSLTYSDLLQRSPLSPIHGSSTSAALSLPTACMDHWKLQSVSKQPIRISCLNLTNRCPSRWSKIAPPISVRPTSTYGSFSSYHRRM